MPGLVVFHVAMVAMVRPVADPPTMVGDQDGGVHNVSHQIIQCLAGGKTLVPAVVSDHKQSPEHGALSYPVERPRPPAVELKGSVGQGEDNCHVSHQVRKGADWISLPAVFGDGVSEVFQRERWRCS